MLQSGFNEQNNWLYDDWEKVTFNSTQFSSDKVNVFSLSGFQGSFFFFSLRPSAVFRVDQADGQSRDESPLSEILNMVPGKWHLQPNRVVRDQKREKEGFGSMQMANTGAKQNQSETFKTRYKTLTVLLCSYSLFFCQVCVPSASYIMNILSNNSASSLVLFDPAASLCHSIWTYKYSFSGLRWQQTCHLFIKWRNVIVHLKAFTRVSKGP